MKIFFDSDVDITPYMPFAKEYFYMCVVTYTLAAAADPTAWAVTGVFAFVLYLRMRKKLQRIYS